MFGRLQLITGLTLLDEERVFGEPAGVEIEGNVVPRRHILHRPNVGEGNRLAATAVVGDGQHDQRDLVGAFLVDQLLQGRHVHVALEGQLQLGIGRFRQRQVDGASPGELDVGARGVEVGVVGNDVSGPAHHSKQDALCGPALVGGNDVTKSGEVANGIAQPEETVTAGIAFVAAHHRRPLLGGHGAGAGVGQQVDQNFAGPDEEEIITSLLQALLALFGCGLAKRFDTLDAEWFDDGLHGRSRYRIRP